MRRLTQKLPLILLPQPRLQPRAWQTLVQRSFHRLLRRLPRSLPALEGQDPATVGVVPAETTTTTMALRTPCLSISMLLLEPSWQPCSASRVACSRLRKLQTSQHELGPLTLSSYFISMDLNLGTFFLVIFQLFYSSYVPSLIPMNNRACGSDHHDHRLVPERISFNPVYGMDSAYTYIPPTLLKNCVRGADWSLSGYVLRLWLEHCAHRYAKKCSRSSLCKLQIRAR